MNFTIEQEIDESKRMSSTYDMSYQGDRSDLSMGSRIEIYDDSSQSFKSHLGFKDGSFNMGITCNGSLILNSSITSGSSELEFEDEWDTFDRETLVLASQSRSMENVKLDENIDSRNLYYTAQRELESIDIKEVSIPKPQIKNWLKFIGYRLRLDEERSDSPVTRKKIKS